MAESSDPEATGPPATLSRRKSWASRHPRLAILAIAGVFYVVLIGMFLFVIVLVFRG